VALITGKGHAHRLFVQDQLSRSPSDVPFVGDNEENVAYHAIAAFGSDTPAQVIAALVELLLSGDPKIAPGGSEALRIIGSEEVLRQLTQTANAGDGMREWALATIGRLPPDMVRAHLHGTPLLEQLAPMLLIAEGANWLAREDAVTGMNCRAARVRSGPMWWSANGRSAGQSIFTSR
jgi:hypothetical protein